MDGTIKKKNRFLVIKMKEIKNTCPDLDSCYITSCKRNPDKCEIMIRKRAEDAKNYDDRGPGNPGEPMS